MFRRYKMFQTHGSNKKIKGTVVLMKKNFFDFNDFNASVLDRVKEFLGRRVSLQLISAVNGDSSNESQGKLGKLAYLEKWITIISPLTAGGETKFMVSFDVEGQIGVPGAFLIRNNHHSEFFGSSLRGSHSMMFPVRVRSTLFATHGSILHPSTRKTVFSLLTRRIFRVIHHWHYANTENRNLSS